MYIIYNICIWRTLFSDPPAPRAFATRHFYLPSFMNFYLFFISKFSDLIANALAICMKNARCEPLILFSGCHRVAVERTGPAISSHANASQLEIAWQLSLEKIFDACWCAVHVQWNPRSPPRSYGLPWIPQPIADCHPNNFSRSFLYILRCFLLQTLLPQSRVDFTVAKITASHEGSYLALSGRRGVTVLELPRRWGPNGQYKEGKESILCRYVNRRIFMNMIFPNEAALRAPHILLLVHGGCMNAKEKRKKRASIASPDININNIACNNKCSTMKMNLGIRRFKYQIKSASRIQPLSINYILLPYRDRKMLRSKGRRCHRTNTQ